MTDFIINSFLSFPRSGVGMQPWTLLRLCANDATLERRDLHSHARAWERCKDRFILVLFLVPTRCVGIQLRRAAPRKTVNSPRMQSYTQDVARGNGGKLITHGSGAHQHD